MKRLVKYVAIALFMGAGSAAMAQEAKEEKEPVYQITETLNVPHTAVDNQGSSGTCWCFAGIGFVEAEILRMYGKEFNLSEMFVVRNAWAEKVSKFVRMHGGSLARIEVPSAELARLFADRDFLVQTFRDLGFTYVTMDLQGYRTGAMNEMLGKEAD